MSDLLASFSVHSCVCQLPLPHKREHFELRAQHPGVPSTPLDQEVSYHAKQRTARRNITHIVTML